MAAKVFEQKFPQFNRREFFIGTVFPDIRYLRVIDRDKTHFPGISWEKISQAENSFTAGLLFHNLVDQIFDGETAVALRALNDSLDFARTAKLLADEMLYGEIANWSEISEYFQDLIPEELTFGVSEPDLRHWHEILRAFFAASPDDKSRAQFMEELGFSPEKISQVNALLVKMRPAAGIRQVLIDFYQSF